MKQTQFEQVHAAQWEQFADVLARLEGKATPAPSQKKPENEVKDKAQKKRKTRLEAEEYHRYAKLYRQVCHFHALARDRRYSSYLVDKLEDLVIRGHQHFYQRKHQFLRNTIAFLAVDFPRLVRQEQRVVWLATALLYLPALAMFLAVMWRPDLVYTVVGPMQVEEFEAMYNPSNRVLGSARDAATNWHMFGFYINNNIGVSFRTFATGLLFGLGSIFFLTYNGLLFGAVAGHLTEVGYSQTFFTFVIGHGSFELTAIAIAGAAGLRLGYSLLAPGQLSRLESVKAGAAVAIRLMYGVIFLLVVAAFVEAFWSSSNALAPEVKYGAGAFMWFMVITYLVYGGRRGSD